MVYLLCIISLLTTFILNTHFVFYVLNAILIFMLVIMKIQKHEKLIWNFRLCLTISFGFQFIVKYENVMSSWFVNLYAVIIMILVIYLFYRSLKELFKVYLDKIQSSN